MKRDLQPGSAGPPGRPGSAGPPPSHHLTPMPPVLGWIPTTRLLIATLLLAGVVTSPALAQPDASTKSTATMLLVRGADGEPEYAPRFDRQVERWRAVAQQAGAACKVIGTVASEPGTPQSPEAKEDLADRQRLQIALGKEGVETFRPLWLVFIGHGTFDGKQARFNLRGPDVSAEELAAWLKPVQRPLVILNTSAASAPFLAPLAGTNRVVITATRSGNEQSYARFGDFLAETMAAPAADLDQDGQTSLLEAFLNAASRVAEFYQTEGRLATEHALIDDNGDGLGTPAEWFQGIRAVRRAQDNHPLDGAHAHQVHLVLSPEELALSPEVRAHRDTLEQQLFALREQKAKLPETDYYARLEKLLLEIARLYVAPAPPEGGTPH
ncbi:MAG: hypothetical protein KDM81_02800 [Verrucomicrobiae bacterium]|nr:hypothetical protein [Verrucomicrobiae bacterium]